jgi:hypothetical protein
MTVNNLQFNHRMAINDLIENKQTICLEVPSREDLIRLLNPNSEKTIVMRIGKARCNPKDQYNKKIGREISSQRLEPKQFTLTNIFFKDQKTILEFETDPNKELFIKDAAIRLQLNKNSNRVYFISHFDQEVYNLI